MDLDGDWSYVLLLFIFFSFSLLEGVGRKGDALWGLMTLYGSRWGFFQGIRIGWSISVFLDRVALIVVLLYSPEAVLNALSGLFLLILLPAYQFRR